MKYQQRILNRLADWRRNNAARLDCVNIAAEADAEIDRLRAALAAAPAHPVAWQVMTDREPMKEFGSEESAELWCAKESMNGSPYVFWLRPLYASPQPIATEPTNSAIRPICCEGDCHYYGQPRPASCACSREGA